MRSARILAFGVDVAEEEVEGGDALGEAALDAVPLGGGDQAREQVVGEDALGAFVAAVDGEGDALVEEGEVGGLLAALKLVLGEAGQRLGQHPVVWAQIAVGLAHLVEGAVEWIVSEEGIQFGWETGAHGAGWGLS